MSKPAQVEIIGVRHFSPACARLVRARIKAFCPQQVLIEGPSDFNARIAELTLGHQLPVALFCYADAQQSYAPFADNSPEWQALLGAQDAGVTAKFIDLPYWHPNGRGRADRVGDLDARQRWHARELLLAKRFQVDGTDALWDHLFEQAMPVEMLQARLERYFTELRAGEPGDASDIAREAFMAGHIAKAAVENTRILVVCGGWHAPELQRLWPQASVPEDFSPEQFGIGRSGNFVIPYSDRRLEAYSGYGAGMPSPGYYRKSFIEGPELAAQDAFAQIVTRLRAHKQVISTASLIAAQLKIDLLANLRGHATPLRADVLDGLLDAIAQDALSAPPPWTRSSAAGLTMQDDPSVRAALLALTGAAVGVLAIGTPMPPLVFEVEELLQTLQLNGARSVTLDRRRPQDALPAQTLWRLHILSISGLHLEKCAAPDAARQLSADHYFQELWQLSETDARRPELIEAGAWGATLAQAALNRFAQHLGEVNAIDELADLLVTAVRAGFSAWVDSLLAKLDVAVDSCHTHGPLGLAGLRLMRLAQQGFWGFDCGALLSPVLACIQARVLWLIDGLSGAHAPMDSADIDALRLIDAWFSYAAHDNQNENKNTNQTALSRSLARIAHNPDAPPSLRGASFGVLWRNGDLPEAENALADTLRAFSSLAALGDFLSGLFALARSECGRNDRLLSALNTVITAISADEFLIGLPALRQAFHFFPPRERAQIAKIIASLLKDDAADLLHLETSAENFAYAVALERRVQKLLQDYGLWR